MGRKPPGGDPYQIWQIAACGGPRRLPCHAPLGLGAAATAAAFGARGTGSLACPPCPASRSVVFTNICPFDDASNTLRSGLCVRIDGTRIASVEPASSGVLTARPQNRQQLS